jgi:hypothetical protein
MKVANQNLIQMQVKETVNLRRSLKAEPPAAGGGDLLTIVRLFRNSPQAARTRRRGRSPEKALAAGTAGEAQPDTPI